MPESIDAIDTAEDNEKQSATTKSKASAAEPAASSSRILPAVAVAVSVAALAVAGWAALRPSDTAPGAASTDGSSVVQTSFTDAERDAATTKLCAAFDTVRKGVSSNTNANVPGGDADIAGSLAVAANARLSLFAGGQYLLQQIEPATPADLAGEARNLANTLISVGAVAISGVPTSDPTQAQNMKTAETLSINVSTRCS